MNIYEIHDFILPFLAECAASFIFGFIVYSLQIGINQLVSPVGPIVAGVAVGFSSIAIIYTFCDMTIAHFNPAITFCAGLFRKIHFLRCLFFIFFQLCGFFIASSAVLGCFDGTSHSLLNTIRPKPVLKGIVNGHIICVEAILTGILVFIAFSVGINRFEEPSDLTDEDLTRLGRIKRPDRQLTAPLVIGLTLGFLAFGGLSSSGGVFNPGLVLPPVVLIWDWHSSWAYWVGQFSGAIVGAGLQFLLLKRTR